MGLTHKDVIVDTDAKCIINVETRKIETQSSKTDFAQYDHNSERIGFTMPRKIDDHDMSTVDRIAIKYLNVNKADMYIVDDLAISEDGEYITFTWLVSGNAIKEVGSLVFVINFRCWNDSGAITYNWTTHPCSTYSIFKGVPSMDSNPEELYDFWARYNSLVKEVMIDTEDLEQRVPALETSVSKIEERTDELEQTLSELSVKVPVLNGTVTKLDDKIPELESKVETLDRALADDVAYAISSDVTEVKKALSEVVVMSPNLINPENIVYGKVLAYDWNVNTSEDYRDSDSNLAYSEKFTGFKVGDIIYSNSNGRVVYYNPNTDLVTANYNMSDFMVSETSRMFKHEIVSTNPFKIDGYGSYVNRDGMWFLCKASDFPGVLVPYGDNSYPAIENAVAEVKEELLGVKDVNFFIPSKVYLIDGRNGIRKMYKENVMVSHNVKDFYMSGNPHSIYTISNDNWIKVPDDGSISADTVKINDVRTGEAVYSISNIAFKRISKVDVTNPAKTKNVLLIGDSLMDGGKLPCEIKNIIVNDFSVTNLNFVGHKEDIDGDVVCRNCGVGGMTLADYNKTNNNDGRGSGTWSNPFLFNGVVSFTDYMAKYSEGGMLDYCVIECGVNDMIALSSTPDDVAEQLKILIDNIHAEYPSCKIVVCGQKYANDIQTTVNSYMWNNQVMNMNRAYQTLCESSDYAPFCVYTDIGALFDNLMMAPHEYVIVYKGSDDTKIVVTDWLHPNTAGYYYIAEAIASALLHYLKE